MQQTIKHISPGDVLQLDPKEYIIIKGAKVHNLNDANVAIPRNKLVVVTGVSGSGKSSLTIDTLYAEGQRRYVESLSSYARQFLTRMNKPDVEYIKGICPAIAIEQKVSTRTTRSTVGTLTEIYDYLRLLFARVGKTISPVSGREVKKHEVSDIVDFIYGHEEGAKVVVSIPLHIKKGRKLEDELNILLQNGFSRLTVNDEVIKIEDLLEDDVLRKQYIKNGGLHILIDRFVLKKDDENQQSRALDSVQTAFYESHGDCDVQILGQDKASFSNRFELDGMTFEEPTPHFFNFNSPYGACKNCEGFGSVIGIDEDLVVPDKNMSVYEGAIACWRGEKMSKWLKKFLAVALEFDFPIHRSYKHLSEEEKKVLWTGNKYFKGINQFFKYVESKSYKIQYRVLLSRYRGRTTCPECHGTRIRKDANYVKIAGHSISEVVQMPISDLHQFFGNIKLNEHDAKVGQRLLVEINNRLHFMMEVGLGYLTLNRLSNTLSGGETQRINLTRSLGSNLTDSLYILDEPSIGLHPRDTNRLVKVLKSLRDLGNTVVIVEHEEEIMRSADYIVDMGPLAGNLGGDVVFQGNYNDIFDSEESLTAKYLKGEMNIVVPKSRRKPSNYINLKGASQHNLKNIDVKIPLGVLTLVTGVSGSGKTTLVKQILYPALSRELGNYSEKPGAYEEMSGDINRIGKVEMIDQNPIGKSSRSNPVTYIKAYDAIRELYASQQLSQIRGFKPKHFSFNVEGGRCEECKGEGEVVVEMQFLADVHLTCEECGGKRFKEEILEVKYNDKSIFDVLEMTVDEAIEFFKDRETLARHLQPLADVGLGYVKLGQSSSTLSGGEAQRVKLASYLGAGHSEEPVLFIFDEPTTGLHFNDINKLLTAFDALIEKGHSIIVIEHNMDVIKSADYVIDLGPEGGELGGYLLYQGEPQGLIAVEESYTGQFLKEKL